MFLADIGLIVPRLFSFATLTNVSVFKSLLSARRDIRLYVLGCITDWKSINPKKVALIARIMWNKSNVKVKNKDLKNLAKYIGKKLKLRKLKD